MKQCLLEQCREVARLNSQVISPAVSRALPTLKSFRTQSSHSRFFQKVDSASRTLPSPHLVVSRFRQLPRISATNFLLQHLASHRRSPNRCILPGEAEAQVPHCSRILHVKWPTELPEGLSRSLPGSPPALPELKLSRQVLKEEGARGNPLPWWFGLSWASLLGSLPWAGPG